MLDCAQEGQETQEVWSGGAPNFPNRETEHVSREGCCCIMDRDIGSDQVTEREV